MLETKGNILSPNIINQADAICFTSNGVLKKNGSLVMGAGVAKAFRDRFGGLDSLAGRKVEAYGNVCQTLMPIKKTGGLEGPVYVISFPTKNHWRNPSDLNLIKKSATELMELADAYWWWKKIYLPRPGCSNGGLQWSKVKSELESILDDRVIIITL